MGHVAPSHHQGHHPAPHHLVSTAQSMIGHPLDASTGTQPSTKPQRPAHVTGYLIGLYKMAPRHRDPTNFNAEEIVLHYKHRNKQRVLMHRHQGLNVRHGLCHIYMRYLYIQWNPSAKARNVLLKLQNLANFHAPFFTNHVYFTPHDRPPLLKGHHFGWPLFRGSTVYELFIAFVCFVVCSLL